MQRIFKVGDIVSFLMAGKTVRGKIIEDLGKLGRRGGHVYDIVFERDSSDPMHIALEVGDFELSAKNLQTA